MTIQDQNEGIIEYIGDGIFKTYACYMFKNSFNLACSHILMFSKHNHLDIFSRTRFHSRYIIEIADTRIIQMKC